LRDLVGSLRLYARTALDLICQIDGPIGADALLDRLDENAVEVDSLSVHTPDLDDVFLALTGRPENEKVATR